MKPLKIFLKNIGPFLEETLDFSLIESMFLIHGKTGAGKTFIFDSMTYALYGELKGNRAGQEKNLKSRFASEEEESFVEFTFDVGGKKYKVRRTVPFEYTNRNGKTSKKPQVVDFGVYEKGEFVPYGEKLEQTNERIKLIIGLEASEFSQIVLLPQGAFANFLKQKSSDRRDTLAKLFPVEAYTSIMEEAKNKLAEEKSGINAVISSINMAREKNDFENAEEKISQMKKEIRDSEKKIKGSDEKLKELERKLSVIEMSLAQANDAFDSFKKCRENKEKISEELQLINEGILILKNKESQIEKNRIKREQLNKSLVSLNDLLPDVEEYNRAYEGKMKAEQKKQELVKKREDNEAEIERNKKECESVINGEEIGSVLSEITEEILFLTKTKGELHSSVKDAEKRDKCLNNIKEQESLKQKNEENAAKYSELLDRNKETLKQLTDQKNKIDLNNKSFAIAVHLKENEPCPVCGSTTHPRPAKGEENLLSIEEEIKTFEANIQTCEDSLNKVNSDLHLNIERIQLGNKELSEYRDLNETSAIKNELQEIENKLKTAEDSKKLLENASKKINDAQSSNIKINEELSELNKSLAVYDSNESNLKKKLKEDELDLNLFNERIKTTESELKSLKKEIDDFEKEQKDLDTRKSAANASLAAACENLNLAEEKFNAFPDFEEQKNEKNKLSDERNNLNQELEELRSKLEDKKTECVLYENEFDALNALEKKRSDMEKEIEPLKLLSEHLNGQNAGKLQFDSWALGIYFETVVAYANERFFSISNGRYKFKLDSGQKDNRGFKGLDLSVIDSFTGSERDPSTLSGGEIFEASISLALAITDVVQNRSGGVQLDSLFIDEGFGTLDSETLDKAMMILEELRETKMIGVISHVEALKTVFPSFVHINKTKSGSSIAVE